MLNMLDFIRAIVRPVLAIGSVTATVGFLSFRVDVPAEWWQIVTTIVAFYFASRAMEKAAK